MVLKIHTTPITIIFEPFISIHNATSAAVILLPIFLLLVVPFPSKG